MKLILSIIALSILLFASLTNAAVVESKDWSFKETDGSVDESAERYDENGRLICASGACPNEYWASTGEISDAFAIPKPDALKSVESSIPKLLGASFPTLCTNDLDNASTTTGCVQRGWLREVDSSATAQVLDVNEPEKCEFFSCFVSNFPTLSYYPRSFSDEGAFRAPSVTNYWSINNVNTPSLAMLFIMGLFAVTSVRVKAWVNKTAHRLIHKYKRR